MSGNKNIVTKFLYLSFQNFVVLRASKMFSKCHFILHPTVHLRYVEYFIGVATVGVASLNLGLKVAYPTEY